MTTAEEWRCPYAEPGKARCPKWRCDCFVEQYPEDPLGLHPEAFVVHLPQLDGSCVLSVAGQGHLPCSLHGPERGAPGEGAGAPEKRAPGDV